MNYSSVLARLEDAYLEPPEDNRKVCFKCSICGEDVLEDDGYYEISDMRICESCMDDAHHYAELDEAV